MKTVWASMCDDNGRPMSGRLVEVRPAAYSRIAIEEVTDDGYFIACYEWLSSRTCCRFYVEGDLPRNFTK